MKLVKSFVALLILLLFSIQAPLVAAQKKLSDPVKSGSINPPK